MPRLGLAGGAQPPQQVVGQAPVAARYRQRFLQDFDGLPWQAHGVAVCGRQPAIRGQLLGLSAVDAHIRGDSAQAEKVTSYLALAATYGDRMSLPGKAIEVLQEGLAIARGDRRLTDDLLRRLRVAGQPEGAAQRIQQLLERGERQTELWRASPACIGTWGGPARRASPRALSSRSGTPRRRSSSSFASRRPGPAGPRRARFGPVEVATLAIERATSLPASALLASCADAS